MWTAAGRDSSYVLVELQVLQREQEELKAKYEESKQVRNYFARREAVTSRDSWTISLKGSVNFTNAL